MEQKPKFYHGFAFDENETQSEEKRKRYKEQREERGFDDTELWNLDYTLACYILPRLKAFKEDIKDMCGVPCSLVEKNVATEEEYDKYCDKWLDIIQQMIDSFQMIVNDDDDWEWSEEGRKKVQRGLDLFAKYYLALWS